MGWRSSRAQPAWFHKRLEAIESIFKLKLLCISAAVSIPSKGQVAVFSAEHAKEHLEGKSQGTIRAPNMRTRETMSTPATAPQTTAAASPAHGGYPGTPIPPTAAPTTTYASTVASTGRVSTLLERELGAHASGYLLAPLTIEEADEELLDHFLSTITNDRLVKIWRKKSASSGRRFIVLMTEEIRDEEMSMTGENTIQAKIDTIVKSGLSEATMHNLYFMQEVYEEWADALPACWHRAHQTLQMTHGRGGHIVAFCAIYTASTMAQTGVSGLVVVDGESFLDALFASAGQG